VPSGANGVWLQGTDPTGSYLSCLNGTSSPALSQPSQATKIDLHNFQFTTGQGQPENIRNLPTDLYLSVQVPLIRSSVSPAAPAVKDSALVQSFTTNTANSLFGTAFGVRSAVWDPSRDRLIIVGRHSSGSNTIYVSDRKGILFNTGLTTSTGTISADSVAVAGDGVSILVLDSTAKYLYGFTLTTTGPLGTSSSLNLASPTNLINTPTGIAYDAGTPNDFYIVGTDPTSSALTIYERNISTGTLVGSPWTLPAAFDATHPPSGLAIEPLSGNFLVVRNYVNGSDPNKTIDIYIINRTNNSSTSFSVNVSDLGSSATGILGYWGISYDPISNHLFLTDNSTAKVYEVIPNQLISPQS
jgi:hypothetical protein